MHLHTCGVHNSAHGVLQPHMHTCADSQRSGYVSQLCGQMNRNRNFQGQLWGFLCRSEKGGREEGREGKEGKLCAQADWWSQACFQRSWLHTPSAWLPCQAQRIHDNNPTHRNSHSAASQGSEGNFLPSEIGYGCISFCWLMRHVFEFDIFIDCLKGKGSSLG